MTIIPWMELLKEADKIDGLGEPNEHEIALVEVLQEVSDVDGLNLVSNFTFILIGSLMKSFAIEEWRLILDAALELFKTKYSHLDWRDANEKD